MTIELEAKRVKAGEELSSVRARVSSLVGEITSIRAALVSTKAALEADSDFNVADVARVDSAIAEIDARFSA